MSISRLVACASLLAATATQGATLVGDTIDGFVNFVGYSDPADNYFLPGLGFVPPGACQDGGARAVVSSPNAACGAEFQFENPGVGTISVDVDANTVRVDNHVLTHTGYYAQVFRISDLDFDAGSIASVIELEDGYSNGGMAFTFGADWLELSWAGGSVSPGTMTASYRLATTPVPLPAAAWLFASALVVFGWRRGRGAAS